MNALISSTKHPSYGHDVSFWNWLSSKHALLRSLVSPGIWASSVMIVLFSTAIRVAARLRNCQARATVGSWLIADGPSSNQMHSVPRNAFEYSVPAGV